MMMRTSIAVMLSLFSASIALAQTSDSYVKLEFQNGYWVLEHVTDNPTVSQAMTKRYAKKKVAELPVQEYQDLYLKYLREHMNFYVDTAKVGLKKAQLDINSVKATAKFYTRAFETGNDSITLQFSAYSELDGVLTKLVFKDGDEKTVIWFSSENNYTFTRPAKE